MSENLYKLSRDEIVDDLVVIKINKRYHRGISDLELYEITRGVWKRNISSVERAKYCLAVYKSEIVEVYKINQWYPAGTTEYKTREKGAYWEGRIEFTGEVADKEIRDRYIGKSVADLYKKGEASPVKTFFNS